MAKSTLPESKQESCFCEENRALAIELLIISTPYFPEITAVANFEPAFVKKTR